MLGSLFPEVFYPSEDSSQVSASLRKNKLFVNTSLKKQRMVINKNLTNLKAVVVKWVNHNRQ